LSQRNFVWRLRLYLHFFNERKFAKLRNALRALDPV
jgi:hypothetical protein